VSEVEGGKFLEASSTPAFQLLAGVPIRHVYVFVLEGRTAQHVSDRATFMGCAVSGIVEVATLSETGETELRILYPGHGMVVPPGISYAFSPIVPTTLVVSTDDEHDADLASVQHPIAWTR
jgi:hypothetical protein